MTSAHSSPANGIGLSPQQFAAAFPFHLALGRDLKLRQLGNSLQRVAPDLVPGLSIAQSFDLVRPKQGRLDFDWIVANRSHLFLLRHRPSGMLLRGEFVLLPNAQTLVFLASPWLTDSSQLSSYGLELRDFAVHDPMTDLLLVMQFKKQALEDTTALNESLTRRQAELQHTNMQLSLQFKVAELTSQAGTSIEAAACLLAQICTAFGWQYGGLWVVRENRLNFAASWQVPGFDAQAFIKASQEMEYEPGDGLLGRV